MSKYHQIRKKSLSTGLNDRKGKHKKGLTYDDFIQTTKVLYTPIDEKEISENPIYRSYFNRYFINQVHRKITTDTEKASSEYAKFTMEFDRDYFRKVPTNTSSDYFIPDQFYRWRWGGCSEPKPLDPNHNVHFQNVSNNVSAIFKSKESGQYTKPVPHGFTMAKFKNEPDYKIVIN